MQLRRAAQSAFAGSWILPDRQEGNRVHVLVRVLVRFNTNRWSGWAPTTLQSVELRAQAVLELTTEQDPGDECRRLCAQ